MEAGFATSARTTRATLYERVRLSARRYIFINQVRCVRPPNNYFSFVKLSRLLYSILFHLCYFLLILIYGC